MQIKFAEVLPLAAAVALVTVCGKNEEEPTNQAAAPAATSAPTTAADDETVVKIDHAAPLTGDIAHLGKDNENGVHLAAEEASKEGLTIDSEKIKLELVGEDDAGDPKTGTAAAQKLVDEHVVTVVGHLNSDVLIPALRIYSDVDIVQISPSSTNPDYTKQGFKATYHVAATGAQQGPALANYAVKTLDAKTVVIVDDAATYGKGLADEFEKTAKADGASVVTREATNDKVTDFKAILTKIKGKKPDVIMYGGMDATGGPFARQAKELDIAAKIVGSDGVCTDKVAELAGDVIDNIVYSEAGLALSKMEKDADFEKKYQARFNTPVQIYAPFTYDAVNAIIGAMKRANSTDPAEILATMPVTNYNDVTGNIAFDDEGDLKQDSVTLYNYKDRKKSVLDVVRM